MVSDKQRLCTILISQVLSLAVNETLGSYLLIKCGLTRGQNEKTKDLSMVLFIQQYNVTKCLFACDVQSGN